MTKYAALMEKIQVTPEMRERLLLSLENADLSPLPRKKPAPVRRYAAIAAAFVVLAAAVWFVPRLIVPLVTRKGSSAAPAESSADLAGYVASSAAAAAPAMLEEEPVQEGAPMEAIYEAIAADDAASLSALTGFPVSDLPYLQEQAEECFYTAICGDLAEIVYQLPERTVRFRKSPGSGDNSGDYNVYSEAALQEISGLSVTLKGNGNGYSLAVWEKDGYSCSLSFSEPATLDFILSSLS